jgi:hypothetical protein
MKASQRQPAVLAEAADEGVAARVGWGAGGGGGRESTRPHLPGRRREEAPRRMPAGRLHVPLPSRCRPATGSSARLGECGIGAGPHAPRRTAGRRPPPCLRAVRGPSALPRHRRRSGPTGAGGGERSEGVAERVDVTSCAFSPARREKRNAWGRARSVAEASGGVCQRHRCEEQPRPRIARAFSNRALSNRAFSSVRRECRSRLRGNSVDRFGINSCDSINIVSSGDGQHSSRSVEAAPAEPASNAHS